MAEPETEMKKKTSSSSSMTLDCSLLADSVSKLQMSPSPSVTKEQGWSLLPEELLQLISTHLEKQNCCFFVDAIHARSVCSSWRSTFRFPSRLLLRQSYCLPAYADFYLKSKDLCTLEKIPLFLFRVKTPPMSPSEYFIGGIAQVDHHMEVLPSSLQCSVKANLPERFDPTVINMLNCQILPLGHRYRIICSDREDSAVAFLQLNEEGSEGEGFVVLFNHSRFLLVLRSSEMRWIYAPRMPPIGSCKDLYTFRGKFYTVFYNGAIFVIDPYSMKTTPLMTPEDLNSSIYLVPSSDDEELFLVEEIIPTPFARLACRVSRLDEDAGEWIVVSDSGDRVLFIGQFGNVACSGKELPDGCGLSGNSILFTDERGHVSYAYKYGVETGNTEDEGFWGLSRESRVLIRNSSLPVVALQVETPKPNWSLLPEKPMQLISTHLEKNICFFVDAIHARSVCRSWRSTFPFPLRKSYFLPYCYEYPSISLCTLEKFQLFLFRLQTQAPTESSPPPSEYFLGGVSRGYHHMTELSSPLQCKVVAEFPDYNPILMNVLDCQFLPLGHHYRIIHRHPQFEKTCVAFLLLNKEEDEFVVLLDYSILLLVLRSSEMRWTEVKRTWRDSCQDLVTFRGKFYAIFENGVIFIIDPYNPIEAIPLMTPQDLDSRKYLVPSSNDEELFLVEKNFPTTGVLEFNRLVCRVSKLDEETGEWIVVSDLGDRVLIFGQLGNVAFSAIELPDDGYGLSGNSILFTNVYDSNVTFAYKYDDDLGFWRLSRENRVLIRNKYPPVLAFRVDRILDT